jgi:dipeptidyl aminopeptidase/acylaminoacyl peptidase
MGICFRLLMLLLVLISGANAGEAASTLDPSSPQERGSRSRSGDARVYKSRITPNWSKDGSRFWYRNDLPGGAREFILVEPAAGRRAHAFDHEAVAGQLGGGARASHLPVERLRFAGDGQGLVLIGTTNTWEWDPQAKVLRPQTGADSDTAGLPADLRPRPSVRTGPETSIIFDNRRDEAVEVFWIDSNGDRRSYGKIQPHSRKEQHTFSGHVWLVAGANGETLGVFQAEESSEVAVIGTEGPKPRPAPEAKGRKEQRPAGVSPDGKWAAEVRSQNIFLKACEGSVGEVPLTRDGGDQNAYAHLEWSPDGKFLVAWRVEHGERKEVFLVRSSPPGGGRATLERRPYALPGDKFSKYELNVFEAASCRQTKVSVDRFEHEWEVPQLHWYGDTHRFAYVQVDRGHQRLRVIEVDAASGATRNLVDERADTFIWTAHTEDLQLKLVNWLSPSEGMIYASERDGWRHLYFVDVREGEGMRQLTRGPWVVRAMDWIDEENRQVWFRASGVKDGEDPYLLHYGRVNFDGSGLVWLTEGHGNHSVQYSPDRRFLIDTYSRVDQPPTHTLRRSSDGGLVCPLEQADISELEASGWRAPEVFVAKGRDGRTDIWGIVCRPRDFDPQKKYPVLECIYAGPQGSYVPKSFSSRQPFSSLTELGFVVVQMDGMGTANRSKAFHDVCWKNLKDAGLPDRILWHQALGRKYSWYDTTRVGIYGTSAGGQNAAAAVLFHPEFYKAAAASCGCHDNRMDKASWNEQWMGYPVGPHYAECSNIDNAGRLRGHLMLIVGELDRNVPPESTLRFADALIRAGKDFDLVVVPGADHGSGGPHGQRKMEDFFRRHLLGQEPPNRNGEG